MNRGWLVLLLAGCAGASSGGTTTAPGTSASTSTDTSAGPSASTSPSARAGEMKAVGPTAYAEELRAAGLDPMKLPQLNKLAPEQLRKVMPLFAKSLGVKCTDCHDMNAGVATMTPRMKAAQHMWNDFVRTRTFSTNEPVFCDSCHHGAMTFLDRHDRPALEKWMNENFVVALQAGSCQDLSWRSATLALHRRLEKVIHRLSRVKC